MTETLSAAARQTGPAEERLAARRSLVERLARARMLPIVQPLMLSMSAAALADTGRQ